MSDPKHIGRVAGSFVRRSVSEEAALAAAVKAAWVEVAGAEIGNRTAGGSFRAGELVVFVESAVWANELQVMSEVLRARLNDVIGKEAVSRVRFTVSRKPAEERIDREVEEARERVYEVSSRGIGRLSEEESLRVEEAVGDVQDAEVREALRRAITTSMRLRTKREENRS